MPVIFPSAAQKNVFLSCICFMILYFNTISAVFQPREAKKRQNIQYRQAGNGFERADAA